ncbi:O-antigen ligase family protein [uncultured Psychroserpens sp.]|uniref:O-antigen ligase family protein n=1 Tax=uncultured Psychroserpens sp. TaxID=255436 RepID=UPI002610774F|nr:O-antigen ligase family protein [uncultured Psychroserpens sp.]
MIKPFSKNKITNLYLFILCFFGISILLPENIRNINLFLFLALSIVLIFQKPHSRTDALKPLFINASLFFVLALSLSYTKDLDLGFKRLMVMAAFPIFSIGFYLVNSRYDIDHKKTLEKFYFVFYIATVLFFIGVFIQNIFNDHINEFIFRDYSERINSKYGKYSMHPIYASLYISIALIISTQLPRLIASKFKKVLLYISILFLVIILVVLARKGVIVVLSLLFTYYFLRTKRKRSIIIFFLLVLILFAFSYLIEPIRNRYLEFVNAFFSPETSFLGSTSYRLNIYECSIGKIFESPLFGYGVGDTKAVLTSCYEEKATIFNGLYFNSHNQFLSVWLASGVFGLIALIYTLFFNFKRAIQRTNFIYFSVLILFLVTLLTENILERQNGVLLFSFFINLFAFTSLKENPKEVK